jgi:hypothetical protein
VDFTIVESMTRYGNAQRSVKNAIEIQSAALNHLGRAFGSR